MTGTAHLIAVSGSHLAIVGFVIEGVLQKTRLSRGLQRGLLVIALVGYAVFTGVSASAVRACCMGAATLLANGAGRRRHGLSALFLTMSIFVLVQAMVLFRDGFSGFMRQCFCHSLFLPLCHLRLGRAGRAIGCCQQFSVTLCSQLATLPVTIPAFGTFSLIAPLANAVSVR